MPVKLSDIEGVMLPFKKVPFNSFYRTEEDYNDVIEEQSSVKIGLNRKKLVKIIQEYFGVIEVESVNEIYKYMDKNVSNFTNWTLTHGLADAIIADEASLIERK